jgi:hypothetical protein
MHTHWHDLDSPLQSLGYPASTLLRFLLADPKVQSIGRWLTRLDKDSSELVAAPKGKVIYT